MSQNLDLGFCSNSLQLSSLCPTCKIEIPLKVIYYQGSIVQLMDTIHNVEGEEFPLPCVSLVFPEHVKHTA